MSTLFHLSRDLVIRMGLLIGLLGLVWALISIEVWSLRGNRYTTAKSRESGKWYVTKVGAAITIAVGAAVFGFGLTM